MTTSRTPSSITHHPTPNTRNPLPIFCDCCPNAPKKMAVLHDGVMEIVGRHGGKKHHVKVELTKPV